MKDRFRGCLLGLAAGDALGAPVEGLSAAEIAARHGRLTEMTGNDASGHRAGQTTDDTAMMLCVLHSYLEQQRFDPQDIAERLLGWYNAGAYGSGALTRRACENLRQGYNFERAGRDAWLATPEDRRLGNGSLVRAAPTGLLRYPDDVHLIGESRIISGITHFDETCKMACACLNLALSHLLMADAHGVLAELTDFAAPRNEPLGAALRAIPGLRVSELPVRGYVVDTLQAALWAAIYCTEFEEGLVLLVNRGGDTDSIAAVAGALLGARFGVAAIPERWLAALPDRELIDSGACRLYQMCEDT